MRKWYAAARDTPSAVLLFVQLAGIVIFPFLGEEGFGRAVVGIFGILVLGLAVAAVRMTPALTWVSLLLGLPVVGLTLLESMVPDNDGVVLTSAVFHAAFYFYTAYALIRYMFDDDHASRDELWATGSTFTVVAWGFAYVYVAVQIVWPDSFTAAQNAGDPRTWVELLFLSITTLSSTGLSDIVPITPHARSAVMLEQIAGMLYLALVVSRMVALTTLRIANRSKD
ncbi:two pore domain potassium channel family protein [Nocardioides guangzhouensis]|uniref:Two pore domain potassium channel family protein n=1 Tax=Nocardioides guangzhouensis TaxID=2497878 RepID=A0A4Q4ZEH7_9ACTN|nr:ion channel [Nocardioides guangzhouensis]RYP86492.1 two pore domain potassium channel family protein [Nocardioides guangzhouensis]